MAWEKRNGKDYYYYKTRIGGRVVSQYLGTGPAAEAIATLTEIEQLQQRWEREQWEAEKAELNAIDRKIRRLGKLTRAVVKAVLVTNGFHTHKGSWRRIRGSE